MEAIEIKAISFNEEALRERYKKIYKGISSRIIELCFYRTLFLSKNPHFVKDFKGYWNEKDDGKKSAMALLIEKKWGFITHTGLCDPYGLLPTVFPLKDIEIGAKKAVIEIDMHFDEDELKKGFEALIKDLKKEYLKHRNENDIKIEEGLKKLSGNLHSDPLDYGAMLKVWTMKKEGLSWSKIASKLGISSQAARNRLNQAEHYIMNGIPNMPAFPQG